MTWLASAEELLAAANTATLSAPVARSFLSPGGAFARDCRLLAVYPGPVTTAPLPIGDFPSGMPCVVVPVLTLTVVFLADCYPAANDHGKPPTPAAVTAWTTDFLTDAEAIWNAVSDAAPALADCNSVAVDPAQFTGPGGGAAQLLIPLRLSFG